MTLRFLSRGEIAEHLGVTLGTVKQYATFPEPDVIVGRNQGWAVETVDRWAALRAAGRALQVGEEIRPVTDDPSGSQPASLGAAPLGGAGPEAAQRSGSCVRDVEITQRRGVDRRGRGA
jgi:predicted DNA-binding transcriptional regulator AlpA